MSSASIWPSLHARGEDNGIWRACLGLTWSSWAQQSRCVVVISHCWTWMVHLCSWIHPRVLWDSYGTELVSMHDDLRRTGHWLKASSWRWLHELSTSSNLCLVQSGGCICLCHMWPCSGCTVQSVFMARWYDFDIACVILMVGSCWCESLFTYYTVVPLAFGFLYRNLCQEAMEDLEMWECTAVSSMVGSEARVLCYCATDDVFLQFTALLHGFKLLPPVPLSSEILI